MKPLHVNMVSQKIHLPENFPAAPTKNFDRISPLPKLSPVLRYFAETSEGKGVSNTVQAEVSKVSRILAFRWLRQFPKQTTKRGSCIFMKCTVRVRVMVCSDFFLNSK